MIPQRPTLLQLMRHLREQCPHFSFDTCERIAKAELEDYDRMQRRDRAKPRTATKRKPYRGGPLAGSEDQPVTMTGGTVHRAGDADADELARPMQTRSARFMASVEKAYRTTIRDETGQTETPDETAKRQAKEAKLKAQADVVCAGLEQVGKLAYRADAVDMWSFDVNEHEFTDIPPYRRICLNPYIAYRLRIPYLNWLQFWLQDHPFCRFWTFTSGTRCTVEQLGHRLQYLHRKLSKLNSQPFMKESGAEIVLRATELGTVETTDRKRKYSDPDEIAGDVETDETGKHWYHPHAHCVVWLKKGKISGAKWSMLLALVGEWWGHNWDEGKRIRDPRECVKYIVKPGDIVRLAETDPEELGKLHEVLFRKKLLQPMGELKKIMSASRKAGLSPSLRWINDKRKWTLTVNHNRNLIADGSDVTELKAADGSDVTMSAARKFIAAEMMLTEGKRFDREQEERTVILARCVPAFNSTGVKSPRVIGYGIRCVDTILKHPLVKQMVNVTRENYEVGKRMRHARTLADAEGISVHTGTPTVFAFSGYSPDFHDPDPPGPEFEGSATLSR